MDVILPEYCVSEPTWFYLSLLLILAVYFRFNRAWSVRNLDLALLLFVSPGLLMTKTPELRSLGYAWLFVGTGLFLLRLFCDGYFKWRPRLPQNLNVPGLTFLAVAAFASLMTKVITEPPPESTVETVRRADELLSRQDTSAEPDVSSDQEEAQPGPTTPLVAAPVVAASKEVAAGTPTLGSEANGFEQIAARIIAVLAHAAVILGLLAVGKRHFGDIQLGLAMATLYLLLPYTAYDVGKVNHVLPAALLVWSVYAYQLPMVAGALVGLACGSLLFPVFLLPLWITFYGRRGALRFVLALVIVGVLLLSSLVLTSADTYSFTRQTLGSIDWSVFQLDRNERAGYWIAHDPAYRLPIVVAFLVMLGVLTIWPRRKNLEHLIAHSTAIVVATQLWYPHQGGVYLLWYLPLLLMVVFRPRLAHCHASEPQSAAHDGKKEPHALRPQPMTTVFASGRQFR